MTLDLVTRMRLRGKKNREEMIMTVLAWKWFYVWRVWELRDAEWERLRAFERSIAENYTNILDKK